MLQASIDRAPVPMVILFSGHKVQTVTLMPIWLYVPTGHGEQVRAEMLRYSPSVHFALKKQTIPTA